MNKINGNTRFTALQHDEKMEKHFLCFYENAEDIGQIEKAVGIIEFESWNKLVEWIALQTSVVSKIFKQKRNSANLNQING